ncbi:hypothetical protein SY27_13620 [Flavobacterium sp. 316]|uniref:hypothetical protein n=1 Tax=Flavobacterium sp. 316 TaxID=1603293 RepID=UPI0005DDCA8C|nr:hypothetical protein [Flavobacterium sp. 316]KIX20182.1 hypothetical protein SY27_13620 [Flavobacterium sp. 316]
MQTLQLLYIFCLFLTASKAVVLGMKYYFRIQNYLAFYLIITLVLEVYGLVKTYLHQQDYAIYFNLYAIFCIVFFSLYFSKAFIVLFKNIMILISCFLLVYIFIYIEYLSSQFLSLLGILVALFYIFNAILWFYQKLKLPVEGKITNDPNFWIATALLLWSTYIIFRFTPMYLFEKEDLFFLGILRKISSVVNIIMYSLFYIALVKYEIIAKNINK